MPGRSLQTDAFVLSKRPPTDAFQNFNVFSSEHGALMVLQRVSRKSAAPAKPPAPSASTHLGLDLFDEVSLLLETSNQGQTWFVKEPRLITRHANIGRSYDALRFASALATLVARNPVHEEGRVGIAALLRTAFAAFSTAPRADIVYFKSLYCFARDEGYPVKQQWFPTLSPSDRTRVGELLNQPLSVQTTAAPEVTRLQRGLDDYLRGHTEILLE